MSCQRRHTRWFVPALVLMTVLGVASATRADITSDQPAAILVFPMIAVSGDDCLDTLIQVSNTSSQPVNARCFYVNANSHCTNNGRVCSSGAECGGGLCLPDWNETDFRIRITPRQPLAWVASQGLRRCNPNETPSDRCIPLDGRIRRGPGGQSNVPTHVPPVAEDPFVGELKCIAVDDEDHPVERNVLVGSTTTEEVCERGCLDVTRHNAIGILAIAGANNGDNRLVLGEEYNACPNTLILNHFFDGAVDPVTDDPIEGLLALVPCSEDFVLQDQNLAKIIAQFLVFNEFEQRFSTSTTVQCFLSLPLSSIDTTQPNRSIFSVGVSGTLVGQTRIHGVGSGGHGLLGVFFDSHGNRSTAANLHFQGVSDHVDIINLP
jgi:hypothetical protein